MEAITHDEMPGAITLMLKKIDYLTKEIAELKANRTSGNLMPLSEFCQRSNISDRKVRQLIKAKAIPYTRAGAKYLLDYERVIETLSTKNKR